MKVLGIGEILWDAFSDRELLGGAALNFITNCQRLAIRRLCFLPWGKMSGAFAHSKLCELPVSASPSTVRHRPYDLPLVNQEAADTTEDVSKRAPEAGYLLTWAYPSLTLEQADRILTQTEAPGGKFLDNASDTSFSIYSRLDVYAASKRAVLFAAAAK